MFAHDADRALCLIDLDTLAHMPVALELGDALRSWCNPATEDAGERALRARVLRCRDRRLRRGGARLPDARRMERDPARRIDDHRRARGAFLRRCAARELFRLEPRALRKRERAQPSARCTASSSWRKGFAPSCPRSRTSRRARSRWTRRYWIDRSAIHTPAGENGGATGNGSHLAAFAGRRDTAVTMRRVRLARLNAPTGQVGIPSCSSSWAWSASRGAKAAAKRSPSSRCSRSTPRRSCRISRGACSSRSSPISRPAIASS